MTADSGSGKGSGNTVADKAKAEGSERSSQAAGEPGRASAGAQTDERDSDPGTPALAAPAAPTRSNHTPSRSADAKRRRAPVWFQKAHAWFARAYGLDLRSLAIFRIGLGYLLLSDLVTRAIDLEAHYTDAGILTRERLVGGWGQKLFYSLHVAGGDVISQSVLFCIAGVFALMLLVGYKTRLATFLSWVFLCSLQGRNYIVLQGGDDLLRVMLFWAIFVPLGVRFSVDAVLAEHALAKAQSQPLKIRASTQRRLPKHVLSLAGMVLVLQLLTMYFVSAALKTGPTWHRDGSAIHLALHHHAFASHFGQIFRQLPNHILQAMTWQTWWLELAGPLLFFIPWGTFWWRTLQVALFMSFHFGLFMTMELGHFPWVAFVYWLVVLPSWFWDRPLYQLTLKADIRSRLRELSKQAQQRIVKAQRWLGEPYKLPRVHPTLPATLFVLVIASYVGYGSAYAMEHKGNVHGERFHPLLMARMYANWGMFAPNPPSNSGWFVTVAKQKNGSEVDVWNGGQPVTFEMPRVPSATYKRQRWRKFGDNILSSGHAPIRGYFLRYLCNEWNEDHPDDEAIEQITLYHMAQTVNWPGRGYGPLAKNQLAKENCPLPEGEKAKQDAKPPAAKAKQRKGTPRSGPPRPRPPHSAARPRAPHSAARPRGSHPDRTPAPSPSPADQRRGATHSATGVVPGPTPAVSPTANAPRARPTKPREPGPSNARPPVAAPAPKGAPNLND